MIAVHVDDLKIGGKPWVIKDLLDRLEKEFGKLSVTMKEFTNTGVHHIQHSDGSITLDQMTTLTLCALSKTQRYSEQHPTW